MTIMLESTDHFVFLNGTRCRIWTGRTEDGALIEAYIAAIASPGDDAPLVAHHLTDTPPPDSIEGPFPVGS